MTQNRSGKASVCLLGVIILCIFLNSCGSQGDNPRAQQAVAQFHSQLDSEQYRAMYVDADERLHSATNEADFVGLLQAVHKKLGTVQQSSLRTSQRDWSTNYGTFITLVYDTQFTGGKASEKFTWHISNKRPLLAGYFINSNALITK